MLAFLRYEKHALVCAECMRGQTWDGKGERPKKCVDGERLWLDYLLPGEAPPARASAPVTQADSDVPGMPEELQDVLPRCCRCPRIAVDGFATCKTCRDRHAAWMKSRTEERRAAGVCSRCGRERDGAQKWCSDCRQAARDFYRHKRLTRPECARCNRPKEEPARPYCTACRKLDTDKTRRKYLAARARGLCGKCLKTPALDGHTRCAPCFAKEKKGACKEFLTSGSGCGVVDPR